jgi:hypothetical protein
MDMTLEQQAAYRNLLDGPRSPAGRSRVTILAKLRRCERGSGCAHRLSRFSLQDDGWHHETLDAVLHQSERRAVNQANYRARLNNAADNGNGHRGANTATNKPDSPDPDPDLSEKKEREKRASLSPAAQSDPFTNDATTNRAAAFLDRYEVLYRTHRNGALYARRPVPDYTRRSRCATPGPMTCDSTFW